MTLVMTLGRIATKGVAIVAIAGLSACGGGFSKGGSGFSRGGGSSSGLFSGGAGRKAAVQTPGTNPTGQRPDANVIDSPNTPLEARARKDRTVRNRATLLSLFRKQDNPNVTVAVNKYIWDAALDVLDFLPIQAADPFSGVIVTGYGTPPGGGRAYRATIYVQDPALDARSLNLALQSRGRRVVSADTVRAIEDAILTRARQLRIRDSKL